MNKMPDKGSKSREDVTGPTKFVLENEGGEKRTGFARNAAKGEQERGHSMGKMARIKERSR